MRYPSTTFGMMADMKRVGEATDEDGRQVILTVYLPSFASWRDLASQAAWADVDEGFALFVAADASGVPTDVIAAFAAWAIARGMFWFSAWGPDCERVHDVVDEVDVDEGGGDEQAVVMTTWHTDQPLDEALFGFWWAFPDDGKRGGPYRIVVAVGDRDWLQAIERLAEHHLASMADSS